MFDGDGIGDDRRINIMMKAFFIWANKLRAGDFPTEEIELDYDRMIIMMVDAEISMKKSENVKLMCAAELQEYDEIFDNIEKRIEASKCHLEDLKDQLVAAKEERKNKTEANEMCKKVQQFPSREETSTKLIKIQEEIRSLNQTAIDITARCEGWKKQFATLVAAAGNMDRLLTNDPDPVAPMETEKAEAPELNTSMLKDEQPKEQLIAVIKDQPMEVAENIANAIPS